MNTASVEMHKYYKDQVEQNNINIIKTIQTVLTQKWYRLRSGQIVKTSQNIEIILRKIIDSIHMRNTAFQTINTQHMTLLEYRLFTNHYRAISVIDCIQFTFNEGFDYLFIHKFPSDTPIMTDLRRYIPIVGGGNDISYIFDMKKERFNFTNIDYSKYDEFEEEEYSIFTDYPIRIIIMNKLYTLLTIRYPEKSKDEVCYIASDIYNILYVYFCYICESLYSDEFLNAGISMYQEPLLSYTDFIKMYESYKGSSLTDVVNISEYITQVEKVYESMYGENIHVNSVSKHMQLPFVSVIGGKKRRTYKRRKE